jgi:UDP-glucose 4-epimerase
MRKLVTGGARYIGSYSAKRLAHHNFVPIYSDNLSTGHRWAVRSAPLVLGNQAEGLLQSVSKEHGIGTLLHFRQRLCGASS